MKIKGNLRPIAPFVDDEEIDDLWHERMNRRFPKKTNVQRKKEALVDMITQKGGAGSGNHDHAGRPGKVGGSMPKSDGNSSVTESRQDEETPSGRISFSAVSFSKKWRDMPFADRAKAWASMTQSERDAENRADVSIAVTQAQRLQKTGDRPSASGSISKDIQARLQQIDDLIPTSSREGITKTATELDRHLKKMGVSITDRNKIALEVVDALAAQENESLRRQLGDHGISHIRGNIEIANKIMASTPQRETTTDHAALYLATIFHDTGYLSPAGQTLGMDNDHPHWSREHYETNVAPLIKRVLGDDVSKKISDLIENHAKTDIDWENDSMGSAMRLSDNLSLFRDQKLPALFRYLPQNISLLEQIQAGTLPVEKAQKIMKQNIRKSSLSNPVKQALLVAVQEVSGVTGKFTLGMLGGRIRGFSWKGDHLSITMGRNKEATRLQQLFDLGQRQFKKFAETFGIDAKKFTESLSGTFEKNGKTLFDVTLVEEKELKTSKLKQIVLEIMRDYGDF